MSNIELFEDELEDIDPSTVEPWRPENIVDHTAEYVPQHMRILLDN